MFPPGQLGTFDYQLYGAANGSIILEKMLRTKIMKGTDSPYLLLDSQIDVSCPETGKHLVSLHTEFTSIVHSSIPLGFHSISIYSGLYFKCPNPSGVLLSRLKIHFC